MIRRRRQKRSRSVRSPLSAERVARLRAAGRLAAEILEAVGQKIRPGLTTGEIDRQVAELTAARGATSAPLGYRGFPRHCCTSVNEVVCHGIPDERRVLREGDIINVDVTPVLEGLHGDTSRTFIVGEADPLARRLVEATRRALWLGIRAVRPGGHTGDIGRAIQPFIDEQGFSVVREYTGHGTGEQFHCPPTILHHITLGRGDPIVPGMVFTIEPMINAGRWKTRLLADDWTAVTVDGSLSAQFEHTLLVHETGVEVLTLGSGEEPLEP